LMTEPVNCPYLSKEYTECGGGASVYVDPATTDGSIKIGATCYELGSGNFDESPVDVAESVYSDCDDCNPPAMAACGTPNADPTFFVTLSWDDPVDESSSSGATMDFLGCTFTNGETKEVFSSFYKNSTSLTPTSYDYERWRKGTSFELWRYGGNFLKLATIKINSDRDFWSIVNTFIGRSTTDIGILTVGDVGQITDYALLNKQKNNTFTDVNNITYTWTEGNGW
jgi:hypothetical protein